MAVFTGDCENILYAQTGRKIINLVKKKKIKKKAHLSPHCGDCAGGRHPADTVSITCLSGSSCIRGC